MAVRLHIAAKELQSDIKTYAKRFGLLEVALGTPKSPSLQTMRKWRKAVPPTFQFAVVAPAALACPRPGEALEQGVAECIQAINALEARCVLVATTADVTPSSLWRTRLSEVFGRLPRDATRLVWEPRGLWEHDDAAKFARKLRAALVCDAVREEVPAGPIAYIRLRALGETRSYGAAALARVAESIADRSDAYVVFETLKALDEAKRLRRALQERSADAKVGGASRIVKPRITTFRVRDDEQE